ncbi:cytochrome P450 [Aspergillus avenaceus]|uniref:Cytochrome P450 n=1 Tax=Aspergillus avenaceus TaxID=36643 RepID=A0A5N6TXN8_ASPAV|nr:cytochrome P450 [Aspergillus avenaceus]
MLANVATEVSSGGITAFVLIATVAVIVFGRSPKSALPVINGRKPWEVRYEHVRQRSLGNALSLIHGGLSKARAFLVGTESGYKVVLAPEYANEIRSHESLSFNQEIAKDFHPHIPGFEPFKQGLAPDSIVMDAIRIRLTQSLAWHTLALISSILQIVAQLSSKVFLGDQICRNPDWLRVTIAYTIDSFIAAEQLRFWPAFMRPVMARFLPCCRKIREEIHQARKIILPVLQRRKEEKEASIQRGKAPERYSDAMEWMELCAKGRPYDPVTAQLILSVTAIHTTSDLITQTLFDLCGKDNLIQPLRNEIVTLKLMDSVIKESQRLKPSSMISMRRLTTNDIELSDRTKVPRGTSLMVSCEKMWDQEMYPEPDTFDGYRFLRLREKKGHENSAQLVAVTPEHMGFGFGKHACPGRFFAANEAKVLLCHILLKYDFKLADGCTPRVLKHGVDMSADSTGRIDTRRRTQEIVL